MAYFFLLYTSHPVYLEKPSTVRRGVLYCVTFYPLLPQLGWLYASAFKMVVLYQTWKRASSISAQALCPCHTPLSFSTLYGILAAGPTSLSCCASWGDCLSSHFQNSVFFPQRVAGSQGFPHGLSSQLTFSSRSSHSPSPAPGPVRPPFLVCFASCTPTMIYIWSLAPHPQPLLRL